MNDLAVTVRWPAPAAAHQHDFAAIPGYEILEELGRGGMGIVFKARQLSSNRPVALKLIRDGAMAGPEDRARFRAEARSERAPFQVVLAPNATPTPDLCRRLADQGVTGIVVPPWLARGEEPSTLEHKAASLRRLGDEVIARVE